MVLAVDAKNDRNGGRVSGACRSRPFASPRHLSSPASPHALTHITDRLFICSPVNPRRQGAQAGVQDAKPAATDRCQCQTELVRLSIDDAAEKDQRHRHDRQRSKKGKHDSLPHYSVAVGGYSSNGAFINRSTVDTVL